MMLPLPIVLSLRFIFLFTIGGIISPNSSTNVISHDTYYIISHSHDVFRMGAVFAIIATSIHCFALFVG